MRKKAGQSNVLVVSLGMSIGKFLLYADPTWQLTELANASVPKVVYDGTSFKVESINDVSYIEG